MTWSPYILALALWGPCGPPAALDTGGCLELPTTAVVRVYDGDTLTLRVKGWPPVFREISIRLAGFDTPEIRGRCEREKALALLARDALIGTLRGGETLRLDRMETGKFFRLVGTLSVDGIPVAERLIEAGLARPYGGGAREGWCGE